MTFRDKQEFLYVTTRTLIVVQPGNIGTDAFVLGVAHHAIRYHDGLNLGIRFVVRTTGRSPEDMTIQTLRGHIRVRKRRSQPSRRLQSMRRMTGGTALWAGEIQVISGQGTGIQRTEARGDPARNSNQRRKQRGDKTKHDDRVLPAQLPHAPAWRAGRLPTPAGSIRVRSFIARSAEHRRTPAFPSSVTLGWPTFGHPSARAVDLWPGIARPAPVRTPSANILAGWALVSASIVAKSVGVDHSA